MAKIHDLVWVDHRLKVRKIAEILGISKNRLGHILHKLLDMKNQSARWLPRLFISDNNRNRKKTSELCLMLFQHNTEEILHHFMTAKET